MDLQEKLANRTLNQHCLGCKIAIGVNILWGIGNYFLISENALAYFGLNMTVTFVIIVAMVFRNRWKLSGEALALVPMLSTVTAFAFIYNTVDIEVFRQMTYIHLAVFIGAGMFLLWNIKYSILSIVYALAINAAFFSLSPLTISEYFGNGAFAVLSVMIFMIISIETRYRLVIDNLKFTLALEQSKEELKESEEQHRLLFEQNPTAMLICSVETMEVIAVNNAIVNKYGYQRKEFIGMPITQLYREVDLNDVLLCMRDAKKGYERVSEWVHVLKDRSEINVEMIAKTLRYRDEEARLISVNDITEVRRHEKELIKARKIAEEAKEMQSQFLSNMSHEIRTPMNGIMGITRILQKMEMNEEQQHYLNAILKSSENLMVIINDILDFSKIEAGKVILEETPFDMRKVLSVAYEILAVSAERKNIYLYMNIDESVPDHVIGDSVRLNQIIMNLVSNAIKFTEKGGVTIHVKNKSTNGNQSLIQFSVTDTGIGISADKKDSIFESFIQACTSTTRKHGGTGLGLTISKQLAELQGGTIWLESQEGVGSTFNLEIPYEITTVSEIHEDASELSMVQSRDNMQSAIEGAKILLVEDHPINQVLALKVLKDWNLEVDLAENGLIALEMIENKNYEMVLMDISMPEMDGYTATREIRSGKYTSNSQIPIVAMTASALIGENQKCFKAGMNDYITKPFDPDLLLEKIYTNLNSAHLKRA